MSARKERILRIAVCVLTNNNQRGVRALQNKPSVDFFLFMIIIMIITAPPELPQWLSTADTELLSTAATDRISDNRTTTSEINISIMF